VAVCIHFSEYQHQLDQQSSELSRLRTYLAESETLSQSTNTLQKEIVNLKGQVEVRSFLLRVTKL